MVAAHISLAYNAQGPNSTVTTACVAGTQAIGEAFRLISRGDAEVMLAGGADSRIDPLMLLAYSALGALSRSERPPSEVSRPFDRRRDTSASSCVAPGMAGGSSTRGGTACAGLGSRRLPRRFLLSQ